MRVTIAAVGRLKAGPEQDLISDWLTRATAAGRNMALGPFGIAEIDERKARSKAEQSARLADAIAAGSLSIALDERGKQMSSTELSDMLASERDNGRTETVFLIGGADGHDRSLLDRADRKLSLGRMVWPHMLARVMLSEQLYRATSILAGSPYHRA